ncbi:hypothetical protein ACWDSJ_26195 [Nocardia sp. NPDC003482]
MVDNIFDDTRTTPASTRPIVCTTIPDEAGPRYRLTVLAAAAGWQHGRDRADEDAAHEQLPAAPLAVFEKRSAAVRLRETAEVASLLNDNVAARHEDLALALERTVAWGADIERDQVIESYRREYGIVIDPASATIGHDPEFDLEQAERLQQWAVDQSRVEALVLAAHDILDAAAVPENDRAAAHFAIAHWSAAAVAGRGDPPRPLTEVLAGLDIGQRTIARIEFLVAYLAGNTEGWDLTDSPLLIDPGESIKGQVATMLAQLPQSGSLHGPPPDLSVLLAPADRHLVRDATARAVAGHTDYRLDIFPHHVDRPGLIRAIKTYAELVADAHTVADHFTRNPTGGGPVPGMVVPLVEELLTTREDLTRLIAEGRGLLDVERTLLLSVLRDLDAGAELPDLLLVDEQTKATVDRVRHEHNAAAELRDSEHQLAVILAPSGIGVGVLGEPGRRLSEIDITSFDLHSTARHIARGDGDPEQLRRRFDRIARRFDNRLAEAQVAELPRRAVSAHLARLLRVADTMGEHRRDRVECWRDRLAAAVLERNDQASRHTIGVAVDDLLPEKHSHSDAEFIDGGPAPTSPPDPPPERGPGP